jgi:hypothetical protein
MCAEVSRPLSIGLALALWDTRTWAGRHRYGGRGRYFSMTGGGWLLLSIMGERRRDEMKKQCNVI